MAIDVLKEHIPGIKEHGITTDANITTSGTLAHSGAATFTGTTTIPTGTLINGAPMILTSGQLTTVSTSAVYTVGTRALDTAGNEYIFLKGVASVVAGSWVTFDELYVTALLTSNAIGLVAVAMAAVVANRWGWFQIYGKGAGVIGNTVTGDKALYISSVTGSVDDLLVTGDKINGAYSRSTSAVTGASIDVQLNYPFVDDAST